MSERDGRLDEDGYLVIRAKWSIDGATSLEDAAVMAEGFAAYLRDLAAEGFELASPVDDDYGFTRKGEA